MTRKNLAYIFSAIVVAVTVCYYLYTLNAAYDGGLIDSLTPYFINLPIIGLLTLHQVLTNKEEKKKPHLWQTILAWCILGPCCFVVLWAWVDSGFYDVSCIIVVVWLAVLFPLMYLEHKRGAFVKQPLQSWAVGYIGVYLLMAITVFTYVQVVAPVTVVQATALVEAQYGDHSYEFIAHLTGDRSDTPLGVYWFANEDASAREWLEVDILTGDIWLM